LIVLTAAAFFLASLLFAPGRGIVARTASELRLRLRIAREHLLRSLYELSEPFELQRPYIDRSQLAAQRSWGPWRLNWWLGRLAARGLVELDDRRVRLTPRGLAAAADVTRTHRLWELFLVDSAGIASDHVDRDADDVEHVLPAPLIRDLEERLAVAGRLPTAPQHVPESPHDLL
jgi:manganese/zinc/iron transport system permease protein